VRRTPASAEWARDSIIQATARYLGAARDALLWQLDVGVAGKPPMYDEMPFLSERLTWDTHHPPRAPAPNFPEPGARSRAGGRFGMSWHGGIVQAYLRAAARGLAAWHPARSAGPRDGAVSAAIAAWRRDWALALVWRARSRSCCSTRFC
jgi:hypothetical protein